MIVESSLIINDIRECELKVSFDGSSASIGLPEWT